MSMIGVYIRVSSHSQKSDSQRAEIQRWLESRDHALNTVQWFEDKETEHTAERLDTLTKPSLPERLKW